MFKNLTNFSYKRTVKEALGFYLAYLFLIMILGGLVGGFLGMIEKDGGFDLGVRIGTTFAVIFSVSLSFLILGKKKLLNNFGFILLALFSGLLAVFIGGLGGLIPAAYMTTRSEKQTDSTNPTNPINSEIKN
jgi:hypothetical protein